MPSLYHFSAVDAASAVDYSRDLDIDDDVVNSPPPILLSRSYAPSPSPLSREKRTLVRLGRASSSVEDGVIRRGPSRRLSMDLPILPPSPVVHVAHPPVLSAVVVPPTSIPASVPSMFDAPVPNTVTPDVDKPKPKVNLTPLFFVASPLLFIVLRIFTAQFTGARPKPSHISYFHVAMERRSTPDLLVADPPRRLLWIGMPPSPPPPTPIVPWPSAEAQGYPSRKRTRIPNAKPLRTIREAFRIYGTTAHIPGPSTNMDSAAGQRFLGPWRPPKRKRRSRKTRARPPKANSGTYNCILSA